MTIFSGLVNADDTVAPGYGKAPLPACMIIWIANCDEDGYCEFKCDPIPDRMIARILFAACRNGKVILPLGLANHARCFDSIV
jgi:hypothetical protein